MNSLSQITLSVCAVFALAYPAAHAAKITSFSPQGEVAQVRQIAIKFDEPMVRMGDPNAESPILLECEPGTTSEGQGRWIDEKNWVFDFNKDLPPGVRCTAKITENLKSVNDNIYHGPIQYRFNTGGPFIQSIRPWEYSNIVEDQAFLIKLNGDATSQSIEKYVWCKSSQIGERIPVSLIEGKDRDALMELYGWDKAAQEQPNQYWALQCQRRFNANDRIQLVYDVGVETPTGIGNNIQKAFNYDVRENFNVNFSCTRENANADCMPLAEMRLIFNAPLPLKLAEQIKLTAENGQEFKPTISKQEQNYGGVNTISFASPFPEKTNFTVNLPPDMRDVDDRALHNAESFPLQIATDQFPVLAKFAAAPFGLVELYAAPDEPPLMPLTVRNIEHTLDISGLAFPANRGTISQVRYTEDADIIRWINYVERLHNGWIGYDELRKYIPNAVPPPRKDREWGVQTRTVSLLRNESNIQAVEIPQTTPDNAERATEVIGIPLKKPGYHVLELASPALGKALLQNPDLGDDNSASGSMYVRTGVLVTNLSVHTKIGRENSLIWVTRLNDGQPVPQAEIHIRDCNATLLFSGKTDHNGLLQVDQQLPKTNCQSWGNALFISARVSDEKAEGGMDMSFTRSDWDKGIESWRFGYPQSSSLQPSTVATTVFDRTLLRAGETVSMKHFIRDLTQSGFSVPDVSIDTVKIVHQGSGQEAVIPIEWNSEQGGYSATSSFQIPETAKLGTYRVFLINEDSPYHEEYYYYENDRNVFFTGTFQVEEFRLPVFEGSIHIASETMPLIKPKEVPLSLQVNYLSGGGASELPVQISAVVRDYNINLPDYQSRFSFTPPAPDHIPVASRADEYYEYDDGYENYQDTQAAASAQKLIADKLPLKLDRNGAGNLTLSQIPALNQAQELLIEATFADPNGEIVTLRRNTPLWPSEIIAGIRNDEWVSIKDTQVTLQAIALDIHGQPKAGAPLEIKAQERITISTRKRLVGGFYAYDNKTEVRDLGTICSGESDEHGLLTCAHKFTVGGNIELIAVAKDPQGRTSSAVTSLWVTSRDELWFGGSDSDRIDLLPENKTYRTGDTARFQLRMPFREATALITVEREGILESHVMQLTGNNPTIELAVKETWGPNVYVGALVLRERLHEVPLYSLFEWGYKNGDQWWLDYLSNLDYAPPTAMVDLSKPAYRLGVAEIKVTDPAYVLDISVNTEKPVYQIRDKAKATITVLFPDGKPAANADVAIAVVDEALLELKKNTSWNLLEAMLKRRSWGVQTSTVQMEVVGRRHYGRKAIPAGGGGGGSSARELFDTLLLWQPSVKLDDKGQATIEIPVNDSLTTFRVVAIAAEGASRFGTGFVKFQTTQDLQLISGLPPVVRSDDDYRAAITIRNTTQNPMNIEVNAAASGIELAKQTLEIPANSAKEAVWNIKVPAELAGASEGLMRWEIQAKDLTNGATDSIITSQRVLTGVPVTVRQATLKQLDGTLELPVKQPSDSLPGRGGIQVSMVPRLADGLPAIENWFRAYPRYQSLETKVSRTLGTRDATAWTALMREVPDYLDSDGLAYYFIPRPYGSQVSSTVLTAYILSSADEAAKLDSQLALPSSISDQMLSGLTKFVEGKIQRNSWAPTKDLDMRRLNAMEALSRYGKFKPAMLGNITISPNQWPTTGVIQWMQILQRSPGIDNRDSRLEEAQQILRARLNVAGTRMGFSTEKDDYWWWCMWNADQNAAYLILATLGESEWQEELPKLVTGFIARQQTGVWHTTTSNLWGGFALEQFSLKFESIPVAGFTQVKMIDENGKSNSDGSIDWNQVKRADRHNNIGTAAPGSNSYFGAPSAAASFINNSVFLPWQASPQQSTVVLTQDGTGRPWATIQSLAAVPLKAPFAAGYNVTKTATPINEQVKGKVTRGDIWRIRIDVDAQTDMTWVVINDPIPGGSTILGFGLGRDSEIAVNTPTEESNRVDNSFGWWNRPWLSYQENAQDGFRAYYEYVPKGQFSIEYTVRLNNEGTFVLPPTRVEAIYAPEMFGETPNDSVTIQAMP